MYTCLTPVAKLFWAEHIYDLLTVFGIVVTTQATHQPFLSTIGVLGKKCASGNSRHFKGPNEAKI
jgi:hypothetical protein